MDTRLKNTSFIKTILMVIIVFYHSICFFGGNWFPYYEIKQNTVINYVIEWIDSFAVYAFVFISGVIFFYVKCEKRGYTSFLPFVLTKAKRLLIPYLFISVVWCIPIHGFIYGWDPLQIINKFLLGIAPNQLWFLLMLFFVFVICWPLANIFKNNNRLSTLIVLGSYLLGVFLSKIMPDYLQILTSLKFIPFFYLGFKTRQQFDSFFEKVHFVLFIILDLFLFIIFIVTKDKEGIAFIAANYLINFLLHVFGVLMIWSTFQAVAKHINWEKQIVFMFFVKRSMTIFLFHQQIIYLCIYFLFNRINVYLLIPINFLVSLSLSAFLATLFLLNKYSCFLIGEKFAQKTSNI